MGSPSDTVAEELGGWPPPEPESPPEIVHLLRRQRADARPRATLLLGWGARLEEALSLWAALGATAVDDPRDVTNAPLIDGVELVCWPLEGEGWMATIWGPGRGEQGCRPAGTDAICLPEGPWFRCIRRQRQLAVIIAAAPARAGFQGRRPGAALSAGLGELGLSGPMLGARITAVSRQWSRPPILPALCGGARLC